MEIKEEYKSLFQRFSCKCGDCRNSCCIGWNVTVSRDEYFKLINLEVNNDNLCDNKNEDKVNEIKSKLQNGFIMVNSPTKERYAMIKKNYFGDCIFHGEDGLCEIHKYFGEKSIASVCREYPRCETLNKGKSVSNSCEKVLELLFEDNEFVKYNEDENTKTIMNYINIMQNRNKSLIERIVELRDISNLKEKEAIQLYDTSQCEYTNGNQLKKLYLEFLEYYRTPFIVSLYDKINEIENVILVEQKEKLYKKFPNFNIMLEKMIINHMHFKDYASNCENILGDRNYLAILSSVFFVLFTAIALIDEIDDNNDLVDNLAKLFRVLGHSNFDVSFGLYLKNEVKDENKIFNIINVLLY